MKQPDTIAFKDDGTIPNSRFPLLLYRGVVGAYPDGRQWDLLTGKPGERPKADQNIGALPIPDNDPVYGSNGPLGKVWSKR